MKILIKCVIIISKVIIFENFGKSTEINKKYKKKSLRQISDLVSQCLDCYDDYQWNKESANRYYEDQQHIIKKNKQLIEQTLKNSVEIDWKKEAEPNIDI